MNNLYKIGELTLEDPYGNDQKVIIYLTEEDEPRNVCIIDPEEPEILCFYASSIGEALTAIDWWYCDQDEYRITKQII